MAGLGTATPGSDSFYVQDCRTVQQNTHTIQTLTGQISKKVASLQTEKDFRGCQAMVDNAVRQASETSQTLARIREHSQNVRDQAEKSNRRMMYRKLSDNLAITARVLEDIIRRFQTEESKRPFFEPQLTDADAAGGEEQPLTGAGLGMGGAEQDPAKERDASLQSGEEDMRILQRIYTDLAVTAQDSQAALESVETHMASASADIEAAFSGPPLTEMQLMDRPLVQRLKQNPAALGGGVLAILFVGYMVS